MLCKMYLRTDLTNNVGDGMEHVNTLKVYKDLISSGVPEKQAEAHVYSLNTAFDSVVTTKDLNILKNDLIIFFSLEIVAIAIFVLTMPTLMKFIRKSYKFEKLARLPK